MITNQLPQLIAQKGISIRQLSRETGVTYSTIWAMVHGRRRSVQLEVLDTVCGALGVQPGDIYQRVAAGEESRPAVVAEYQAGSSEAVARRQSSQPSKGDTRSEWRSW